MAIIRYRFRFPTLPALNPQGRGGATAAVTRAGPGTAECLSGPVMTCVFWARTYILYVPRPLQRPRVGRGGLRCTSARKYIKAHLGRFPASHYPSPEKRADAMRPKHRHPYSSQMAAERMQRRDAAATLSPILDARMSCPGGTPGRRGFLTDHIRSRKPHPHARPKEAPHSRLIGHWPMLWNSCCLLATSMLIEPRFQGANPSIGHQRRCGE